jgi:cell division protease FtsH
MGAITEILRAWVTGRLSVAKVFAIDDKIPVPEWDRFPGAAVVQGWANEVKLALAEGERADWPLVGPAIAIQHEDAEECALLIRRAAREAGLRFARVPRGQVRDMLPGLRLKFRALAPVLVYLEPEDWLMGIDNDRELTDAERTTMEFQSELARELKDFNARFPVPVATCTDWLGDIAPPLRELGAFDRDFIIPPLSNEAVGIGFIDLLGRDLCGETLIAVSAKLGALLRREYAGQAARELAAMQLRRLAHREKRRIEFNDVADLVIRGAAERAPGYELPRSDAARCQTAIHEAGHAAVAVLASGGRNVPDYASIIPGCGFAGIVMPSVSYTEANKSDWSYADVREEVRICIAGRAAEDLVFGAEKVSAGAASDLEQATSIVLEAFGSLGFAPNMEAPGVSASNLAVVLGSWEGADYEMVYPLVRTFLATEYAEVMDLLARNRNLLESIADRLMWDPLIDQQELSEICQQVGAELH